MRIAYIIGTSVIAIGGFAVYFIKRWMTSSVVSSRVEEGDVFDKGTINKWVNSLDLPEIDSSYHFYAVKVNRNNLNKLHMSQNDKLKLKGAGSNKLLMALVVSDSNLNTKASSVFICNSISPDLSLDNEVTELHLKY